MATPPSDEVDVIVCVTSTGVLVVGRPSLLVVVKTTAEVRVELYRQVLDAIED